MKSMFKKIMLMVLVAGVALTSNVFAAETKIEVNDFEVTIDRTIGEEFETYEIKATESLKAESLEELSFKFSDQNNFSIKRAGDAWSISLKYMGESCSISSVMEMILEVFGKESIKITGLSNLGVIIEVSKNLSDEVFNRIFDTNANFTFSAKSTEGTIEMEREHIDGKNQYIISSGVQELKNAKIIDGNNELEIAKEDSNFNVSGKYNGTNIPSISIPSQGAVIEINGCEVGISKNETGNFIITPDSATIARIKKELKSIKESEMTISGDGPLDISSNSNIENVVVSENVQSPQIKLPATIANELTIESKNTGTRMVFPEGLNIIDGLDNGIMDLPTIKKVSIPSKGNKTRTSSLAIDVGKTSGQISFSDPVTLIFPNMKGKNVGFFDGEEFIEITNTCPSLPALGECKINDGNDLIVRTYHFTTFAVYTETTISTGGSSGGGATALSISNVNVKTDNTEAIISFNASESSSAILKYGTSAGNYTSEVEESEFKTSHTFNLKNLSNQKYYYRIEIKNSEGSSANYSGDFTIQTTASKNDQIETSTKVKEQETYNYNGIITTKPLEEMNKEELFRVFLILLLKSLLAQRGITL